MAPGALTIRPAVPADAAAIAGLSDQLGYPVSPAAVARRLERLLPRPDQVVLVSDADGTLAGWIHAAEQDLVESDRRCEILGLVVDQRRRRAGVGRRLVEAVEAWAGRRGLEQMSVRSNVARVESHPFYEGLGYRRVKTQQVYRKTLALSPSKPARGPMSTPPIALLVEAIQPPPGRAGWHGGPTPVGALRGVGVAQAWWTPGPRRKSIWTLALHIAYWNYAVRRLLDGSGRGGFPRGPSNWPAPAGTPDPARWRADVALLREEHARLVEAAAAVPLGRLGRRPPGSRRWTYGDLITGIALHDAYHTGQIQLMKRLWRERRTLGG